MASEKAEKWAEENICKKLCTECIMSNGSKCNSYSFAMKAFDAGVESVNKRIGDVNDYYDQLKGMSEDYQAGYIQAEKDMPKQFEAVRDIIRLQKEIDELKELNKWHDVKIKLPKENKEYLVSYDENYKHSFYVLHYNDGNWYEEGYGLSAKPYWWKEIE